MARAPRRSGGNGRHAPVAGAMPPGFPATGSSGLPTGTAITPPGTVDTLPPRGTRDASGRLIPGAQVTVIPMLGPDLAPWGLTDELGATGLRQWSGLVREELLPKLQGTQEIYTYREMSDNDPIIGASLTTMDLLARKTPWRVDPAGDTREDLKAAAYLESIRHDMAHTWPDHISEALTMLTYGWSLFEIVYKVRRGPNRDPHLNSRFDDGLIGVRKLGVRGQDTLFRWQFDATGGIQAMIQRPPPDYYERVIPIDKSLLYRVAMRKNNPQGRSPLRNAYRSWYMKKRIEELQAIGVERDLAGLPVALVPPQLLSANASADQKALLAAIKKIVVNVRNDEQAGVIFPKAYDARGNELFEFKLLSAGGSRRSFDTATILEYYDQRIAMSLMTDFLFLGMAANRNRSTGSYNLGEAKLGTFAAALTAYLDVIENVLNRYLVPRLFELNHWQIEHLPEFKHEPVQDPDLTQLAAFVTALSNAGMPMFPDEELEAYLRRLASLPVPPAPETAEEAGEQAAFDVDDTSDEPLGHPTHAIARPKAQPGTGSQALPQRSGQPRPAAAGRQLATPGAPRPR